MAGRTRRSNKKVDYKKLHEEGMDELSLVPSDAEDSLLASEEGELSEESDQDEEGEIVEEQWKEEQSAIWLQLSESEFYDEFEKAKSEGDFDKLELLLEVKQKRCNLLKVEIDRENERDREQKQKMKKLREIEDKFRKLNQTEANLNKTLASSRGNTPATTPRTSPRVKSSVSRVKQGSLKKKKVVTTRRRSAEGCRARTTEQRRDRGELNPFQSFLKPAGSNREKFTQLLSQAKIAADNLSILDTQFQGMGATGLPTFSQVKGKQEGRNNEQKTGACYAGNETIIGDNATASNNSALIDVNSPEGQSKLIEVLSKLQLMQPGCDCLDKREGGTAKIIGADKKEVNNEKINKSDKQDKKLTSGRAIKPDESDIKLQVKFAHEKLDATHAKERIFDKLSFPLLIAGELEIASLPGISSEERACRVKIAKTIAYHKLYLADNDLRNGYDATLKLIEQGVESWSDALIDRLNRYYEFRANVAWREKAGDKPSKSPSDKNPEGKSDEGSEDNDQKVIYCMDYNKGICTNSKSHLGKWKGRKTMKWHVCRHCLKSGELNNHAEKECKMAKK